jgi:hypothetical protein
LADDELPVAGDQRYMANLDARDIRYRVEPSRNSIEGNAQVTRARLNR